MRRAAIFAFCSLDGDKRCCQVGMNAEHGRVRFMDHEPETSFASWQETFASQQETCQPGLINSDRSLVRCP